MEMKKPGIIDSMTVGLTADQAATFTKAEAQTMAVFGAIYGIAGGVIWGRARERDGKDRVLGLF